MFTNTLPKIPHCSAHMHEIRTSIHAHDVQYVPALIVSATAELDILYACNTMFEDCFRQLYRAFGNRVVFD